MQDPTMMSKFATLFVCILTLVSTAVTAEDDTSTVPETGGGITSEANEFYIGFLQNYIKPEYHSIKSLHLNTTTIFIATNEVGGATVTITDRGKQTIRMIQEGRNVPTLLLPIDLAEGARVEGSWDRNKGIRIKAEESKKIVVFGLNEELHSVEGFTAFPCARLPAVTYYEYYAVSVPPTTTVQSTTADSAFLLVGCENNTNITVMPSQSVPNPSNPLLRVNPGQNFTVTLNEMQTLYFESKDDLTGSRVLSDAPISFFSGHECGNVPYNIAECDHLVEQFPPTATWGNRFFTAPTFGRTSGDVFKLLTAEDNALVQVECIFKNQTAANAFTVSLTRAGESVNFTIPSTHFCSVVSNRQTMLVQFTPGQHADDGNIGDPFMVIVPAVHQYTNEVTAITASALGLSFTNYLNIFVAAVHFNSTQIKVNSTVVDTWVAIPCNASTICGYVAQVLVDDGIQHVSHDDPHAVFGVTVYGLSSQETYAYVGGLKLSVAGVIVEPLQTSFFIMAGGSICLKCELRTPFVDQLIEWEFNGAPIDYSDNRLRKLENGSLCITNAAVLDSGSYMCDAETDTLTYSLSVTGGIVVQPPSCSPQPLPEEAISIGIGFETTTYINLTTSFLMICCIINGPVDQVTWLVNENLIDVQEDYEIGSNYLKVRGPFTEGCITYTCQAEYGAEIYKETSEVCSGSLSPPREVSIDGSPKSLEGSDVILVCSADGFPEPTIIWTSPGESPLPENALDSGNGTLVIADLSEGLNGNQRVCCDVGNERGAKSDCITITVLVAPVIHHPRRGLRPLITRVPEGYSLPLPYAVTEWAEIGQDIVVVVTYNLQIDCSIARGYPSPAISWFHDDTKISNSSVYGVFSNGSLLIQSVTSDMDNTTFTCIATTPDVGTNKLTSSVTVIEPPKIAIPSSPYHGLSSCSDFTNTIIVSEQVGYDLCVRADPQSKVYLNCEVESGTPTPTFVWWKDEMELNNESETHTIFSNNTLVIHNITLPVEALLNGQTDVSGKYTCVVHNAAGIARASSYIVPFGDISTDVATMHYLPLHLELYKQLHESATEHMDLVANGLQHVVFLAAGKILRYEDYYPGRQFDGGEDTIPPRVMEDMFSLVDVIPNAESIVAKEDESRSLSETYEFLVNGLKVESAEIPEDILMEARNYLQENVIDIGDPDATSIPRLSLYLQYKNKYYTKRLEVDTRVDYQREKLIGSEFSKWHERYGHILQDQVKDDYIKWEMYGNKTEIEKRLSVLNLQDHSQTLEEARAILKATRKTSTLRDEQLYYPVQFDPHYWFSLLKNRVEESVEQLQYHLAQLEALKQALEFTWDYLDEEVRNNTLGYYMTSPNSVFNDFKGAKYFLEYEVRRSEMQRYQCLVSRNPIDCHLYTLEYQFVNLIIDAFAELYWKREFLHTALDHRQFSIPAISNTVKSLSRKIDDVNLVIRVALLKSSARDAEAWEKDDDKFVNRYVYADFSFSSQSETQERYNYHLPQSIQNRLLWYIDPQSTILSTSEEINEYNSTMNHLNAFETNISASLMKVNIHRRWFKPNIFGELHLGLKNESILVSPGVILPPEEFRTSLTNGPYKLSSYPSSLLLATNVQLSINVPFPFYTLPTLIKMSYDARITGGFGPFTFGPLFQGNVGRMKFSVAIRDSTIVISLPGTHLIGYICDVVPKHPKTVEPRRDSDRRRRAAPVDSDANMADKDIVHSRFGQWLSAKTDLGNENVLPSSLEKGLGSQTTHYGAPDPKIPVLPPTTTAVPYSSPTINPPPEFSTYSNVSDTIGTTVEIDRLKRKSMTGHRKKKKLEKHA